MRGELWGWASCALDTGAAHTHDQPLPVCCCCCCCRSLRLPACQVLRVHALCCTKVPANPLTPLPAPAPAADLARALSAAPLPPTEQQRASLLRGQVLSLLSTAVGGDDLAAEYLLLTCLGTVRRLAGLLAGRGGGCHNSSCLLLVCAHLR
jgi:hypothetical protein